jgi:phage regulator Rha-like protein
MSKTVKSLIIPDELVMSKIYLVRGQKIMLDSDLAEMYNVQTKRLKESVRRNASRFPVDFMFQLTSKEFKFLRPQIATLEKGRGNHTKYLPFVFTEQGVSMLSSILNSKTAIRVNIQIIRVFTRMREMIMTHKDIWIQLEKLEKKLAGHDIDLQLIFNHLKKFLIPPSQSSRRRIGFKANHGK